MEITYSKHWVRKHLKKRKNITDDAIEYAILSSKEARDRNWADAFNVICRIPPSGRTLKVVYKKLKAKVFIITTYWID